MKVFLKELRIIVTVTTVAMIVITIGAFVETSCRRILSHPPDRAECHCNGEFTILP